MNRHAFTLVELIVTTVIGVVIAGAVTTSISQFLRARSASASRHEAYSRAESAAARIATDLLNTVRNPDLLYSRISITPGASDASDELLVLTKSTRPLRGDEYNPEGDEYESQFRIAPGANGRPALWRRLDPGLDLYVDAGGIAAPVVPGVIGLSLEGYDGTEWFDKWDSDTDGLPHAVRVTITALSDDGRTRAVARRLVAIDRVPLPPEDTSAESDSSEPTSPGNSGSSGSGGTPQPTPGGSGGGGGGGGGGPTGGGGAGGGGTRGGGR